MFTYVRTSYVDECAYSCIYMYKHPVLAHACIHTYTTSDTDGGTAEVDGGGGAYGHDENMAGL